MGNTYNKQLRKLRKSDEVSYLVSNDPFLSIHSLGLLLSVSKFVKLPQFCPILEYFKNPQRGIIERGLLLWYVRLLTKKEMGKVNMLSTLKLTPFVHSQSRPVTKNNPTLVLQVVSQVSEVSTWLSSVCCKRRAFSREINKNNETWLETITSAVCK